MRSGETQFAAEHDVLSRAWAGFLEGLLPRRDGETQQAPPRIADRILLRSGYLQHFPHQVLSLAGPLDGLAESLTPAVCLHLYPRLQGADVEFALTCVSGECTRFEGGRWEPPYRLRTFHMLEYVAIGSEAEVEATRAQLTALVASAFADLGLGGGLQPATDAFFLGQGDGAQRMQQLKGLKREYRVLDGTESIALASLNQHEDYFGRCFDIRAAGGPAHSFCAAFGLDRLATFGLRIWGPQKSGWPDRLTRRVQIP